MSEQDEVRTKPVTTTPITEDELRRMILVVTLELMTEKREEIVARAKERLRLERDEG